MLKRQITFLLLLLFGFLFSQNIIIEYNLTYNDQAINESNREFLIIKDKDSYYFNINDFSLSYDKIFNERIDKIPKTLLYYNDSNSFFDEYKWKLKSGQYIIKDVVPKINWKIVNEYKNILNYKCKKAIGEFRGRKYLVWYTDDIPLSKGPWKLMGLPGLILEAKDEEGFYSYTTVKIIVNSHYEFPKQIVNFFKIFPNKYKISNKEYIIEENKLYNNLLEEHLSNLPKGTIINEALSMRYFSREKSFEWEETNKP